MTAPTKAKGDLAEVMVAADLIRRGHRIAFPYGEDWDFDLIVCRDEKLERVQVKHTHSNRGVIRVQCYSSSLTNGKVKVRKQYTADTVDWIAVFDPVSDCCYYVPSSEFAEGRREIQLRVAPPRNNQRSGIHLARDYLTF